MTLANLIDEVRQLPLSQRYVLLDVLQDSMKVVTPLDEEDDLSPQEQVELDALSLLSDDALWTIAGEQMPQAIQLRMQALMDKNNLGGISAEEYQELSGYVARGDRLMLRKAEASAILTQRGYQVTKPHLKPDDVLLS